MDSLKVKLLEKLEQSLGDLQLKDEDISSCLSKSNDPSKLEKNPELVSATAHEVMGGTFMVRILEYVICVILRTGLG